MEVIDMIKGKCLVCNGSGEVYQTERVSFGMFGNGIWKPCLACGGKGKVSIKQKKARLRKWPSPQLYNRMQKK